MDLSKLPRLSNTTQNPPAPPGGTGSSAPGSAATPGMGLSCPTCGAPLNAGARFCEKCGSALAGQGAGLNYSTATTPAYGTGAEAWISIGLGILLLFVYPTLVLFAASKTIHTHFAPYADGKGGWTDAAVMNDVNGNVVARRPYLRTTPDNQPNFPSDLVVTLFALALILEGIALLASRRRGVVMLALVITGAATLLNLWYLVATFRQQGLAIISALAVLFGVYMVIFELGLLRSIPGGRTPART